jgi:hypothetical protein
LVSCSNWSVSYRLTVPADWVSGVYLVKLVRHDTGGENGTVFVIRDDNRKSDILFQLSVATYLAYNSWDGKCLYSSLSWDYCPTVSETSRAVKVSFNTPYISFPFYSQNTYFWSDYPMVYWLEAQGYDVSYFTDIDTHGSGKPNEHNKLLDHRVFLVVGHDEYWSQEMRDAITAARDAGVHLGFFSSNVSYWRIRLEPDPWNGQPDRVVVTYKTTESGPPDPSGYPTGTWRDPEGANDPENALIGVQYVGDDDVRYFPLRVTAEQAKDQIYRHTGLQDMPPGTYVDIGKHLIGWEWDAVVNNGRTPEGLVVLAASPVYGGLLADAGRLYFYHNAVANVTRYIAPGGAIVFASGTNQWAWGLAIFEPDRRIQQITYNLLADMGAHPATPAGTLALDNAASPPAASSARMERDLAVVSVIEKLMRDWAVEDFEMPAGSLTAENAFLPVGTAIEPTISNVGVTAGQDKVTILWKTDRPADGHVWVKFQSGPVDYRMTGESPGVRPIAAEGAHETTMQTHVLTLTGLRPNTTYYYNIASADAAGHTALSVESSFQTQRGSLTMEAKNAFQPVYRQFQCWFKSNRQLAIGLGGILAVAALLGGWLVIHTRRSTHR